MAVLSLRGMVRLADRPGVDLLIVGGRSRPDGHSLVAPFAPRTGGALELPVEEALAQIRSGGIADAKTIMLLQWTVLDGPCRHPCKIVRGETS